jgi:hypothetical protein
LSAPSVNSLTFNMASESEDIHQAPVGTRQLLIGAFAPEARREYACLILIATLAKSDCRVTHVESSGGQNIGAN